MWWEMRLQLLPWLVVWWCARGQAASCPSLELKKDFSIDKYMGVWYEIQAQESIFQSIKSCLSSNYRRNGEVIEVTSQGLDASGSAAETHFTLSVPQPDNPAHMVTDFVLGVNPPFDIVDTDYVTFSCVHSCVSIVGLKTEFVFIYSRNRTLDAKNVKHCRKIFKTYGIEISGLVPTQQTDCHQHYDL